MTDSPGFLPTQSELLWEGAAAATGRANNQRRVPSFTPGIVMGVAIDETTADVAVDSDDDPGTWDDDSANGVVSCSLWYSSSVRVGDRVMVMFYPPHGVANVGRLNGAFEPWRYVGEEDQPPFEAAWQNGPGNVNPYEDNHAYVSFRRVGRWVELRGRIQRTSGGSAVAFIVPEGYRPINRVVSVQFVDGGNTGYVVARPDGGIEVHDMSGASVVSPSFLYLDNFKYSVDVFPEEEV